ncbi:MAG TPA: heavy metal-binding domain-containing protein, partial [Acidimicrobiales bacterium]
MLISTMNDVPGYRVTKVLGECFGLTVRSRNAFSQFGAGLKSL